MKKKITNEKRKLRSVYNCVRVCVWVCAQVV